MAAGVAMGQAVGVAGPVVGTGCSARLVTGCSARLGTGCSAQLGTGCSARLGTGAESILYLPYHDYMLCTHYHDYVL